MADSGSILPAENAVRRIFQILKLDKREIWSVYFYAILNGLIQLSLPLGIQSIISFVLGGSISTSLVILIIVVVVGVFLGGLLQVNQMKIIEKVQQKMFVRYSFEYAHRIPRLDLKSVDQYYLPELVNRFFDTISLQKGISKLLLDIPTATIQILFGLILLSFYHPVFIAFSLLLVAIVYFILYYSGNRGLQTSLRESDFKYGVAGWLEELARVVRSFKFSKVTSLNLRRTDGLVNGYLNARTSHFRILLFQYWTLVAFKVLITAAMLIVGSVLLIQQQLNIGQFIAAEIVILLVLNSVEKLIINLDKVYDVLTSVEKLGKVTDKPVDMEGEVTMARVNRGMKVVTNSLSFQYDSSYVLKDVNFEVEAGKKIAVMGTDGSGKSTLLRLLSGVFPSYEGGLLIDDIPLRNYLGDSFRQQTGVLLQQQDIFLGTLLENITMGDDQVRPEDIMNLAARIGLSDFLQTQDEGFSTMLDPMGKRLSRSVIQKILLLRALINHPRLMLLEEPWRGLEEENRIRIQDFLLNESPASTVFVESNDETFARRADEIMVFEEGRLSYYGPWEDFVKMTHNQS
jgi:ABC-type bacteriocin/lantibiotic exporter with double-glycine peptidase domain